MNLGKNMRNIFGHATFAAAVKVKFGIDVINVCKV